MSKGWIWLMFHPLQVRQARWRTKSAGAAGDLIIVRPAAAAPPSRPEQVEQHRAAEAKIRRARLFGTHAPRDKDRVRVSRKNSRERESTPQTPWTVRPE